MAPDGQDVATGAIADIGARLEQEVRAFTSRVCLAQNTRLSFRRIWEPSVPWNSARPRTRSENDLKAFFAKRWFCSQSSLIASASSIVSSPSRIVSTIRPIVSSKRRTGQRSRARFLARRSSMASRRDSGVEITRQAGRPAQRAVARHDRPRGIRRASSGRGPVRETLTHARHGDVSPGFCPFLPLRGPHPWKKSSASRSRATPRDTSATVSFVLTSIQGPCQAGGGLRCRVLPLLRHPIGIGVADR